MMDGKEDDIIYENIDNDSDGFGKSSNSGGD